MNALSRRPGPSLFLIEERYLAYDEAQVFASPTSLDLITGANTLKSSPSDLKLTLDTLNPSYQPSSCKEPTGMDRTP